MSKLALRKYAARAAGTVFALGLGAAPAWALNCQEVRQLTGVYFKMHYVFHNFDEELSRRTLDTFIKGWDPGKVYFLQSDVDDFTRKYGTKLGQMVENNDCSAIDDIVNTYAKRFAERQKVIDQLIDRKHDFTKNEYMDIDRKNMAFAKTLEEVNDRWRKRVKYQLLQLKASVKDLTKARAKLHHRYELAAKRQKDMTSDDVYSMFLNSFATGLDPHSEYMPPEELEDFRINTRLSLEGIGAVLRSEDGFTTIQSLVPGGAAAKTGKIKSNDKIVAVAQGNETPVDVIDMDLREVVKLIRGTHGTQVRLTIMRDVNGKSTQFVVPVVREQIQLSDRAARSDVFDVNVKDKAGKTSSVKIGLLTLPSFYMDFEGREAKEANFRSSSADMLREIAKLKKDNVKAIVVDLRNNGGGSLDESINIAGMFDGPGPVVQVKGMDDGVAVQSFKDNATAWSGPLVVMINRQSASASEIFAGAIQDYGRGIIVGDTQSFGKGTVQNLNDISDRLGAAKVTISKFYRPSGSSTQLRGVASDIVLPDIMDQYEIGEKHYDYALPWEKIQQADFKPYDYVKPYVAPLKVASQARIAKDAGFKKVAEAVKEYQKNEKDRTRVSLKETKEGEAEMAAEDKLEKDLESEDMAAGPNLNEDVDLQETLRVAADYTRLLEKKPLGEDSLPGLKEKLAAAKSTKPVKKVGPAHHRVKGSRVMPE